MGNIFKINLNKSVLSDILISSGFCIMLILTRIPFKSKFLYDWDSVNYALAFENFNIELHQPHPPGYIFYVALGKAVNYIFNDPNNTMIFISIVFTILTVLIVYFLVKQMFTRKIAIISALILIFNPIFWFYGEIASIYPAEAVFAALIAFTSYQVLRGKEKFIYISAMVLGLSGGFRPDLIIFMFPLWLFTMIYSKLSYKKPIIAFVIVITSALTWFIPTIISTGGYANYNSLTNSLLIHFFNTYSLIFGAEIHRYLMMLNSLILWTFMGMGIIGSIIIMTFIIYRYKNIFKLPFFKNPKLLFLILWILPGFLFYLLIFIPKSGYTMVYLPCLSIIVGYVFVNFSSYLSQKFRKNPNHILIQLLILCIIFNFFNFYSISDNDINRNDGLYFDSATLFKPDKLNPENTIIIIDDDNLYRKLTYSFPNYKIYGYSSVSKALWYKNADYSPTLKYVDLNASTEYVVWILPNKYSASTDLKERVSTDLKTRINLIPIQSSDKMEIYYSNIKNQAVNLEFKGITLKSIN